MLIPSALTRFAKKLFARSVRPRPTTIRRNPLRTRLGFDTFEDRAVPSVSGAIYTTLGDGSAVNQNIYEAKEDVYLNGGPRNTNTAGLSYNGSDDFTAVFMVTNPNGSVLLSTDAYTSRLVSVVDGLIAGAYDPDDDGITDGPIEPHANGTLSTNGTIPVQLIPYDDTTNNGGEYKVWLTPLAEFDVAHATEAKYNYGFDGAVKTDNFKIETGDDDNGGQEEQTTIVTIDGRKVEDLNGDGSIAGDPGLENWGITITVKDSLSNTLYSDTIYTSVTGGYSLSLEVDNDVLADGISYSISEVQQWPSWTQTYGDGDLTTPTVFDPYTGTLDTVNTATSGNDFGNFKNVVVSGFVFYDNDVDGVYDQGTGDFGLNGWTVNQSGTSSGSTTTAGSSPATNGGYSFTLAPGTYTFSQVTPSTGTWVQTAPTTPGTFTITIGGSGIQSGGTSTGNNFGNVQTGGGNGRTLGFWSNKNGKAAMEAGTGTAAQNMEATLTYLRDDLNLRNADGTAFNPTSYTEFRNWLLGATATNMAYMLSAQLAAMALNVRQGFVTGGDLIYAPGTTSASATGFATVNQVIAEANASLAANGYTVASGATRTSQESLKNALDRGNNNLNFLLVWNDANGDGIIDAGELS